MLLLVLNLDITFLYVKDLLPIPTAATIPVFILNNYLFNFYNFGSHPGSYVRDQRFMASLSKILPVFSSTSKPLFIL